MSIWIASEICGRLGGNYIYILNVILINHKLLNCELLNLEGCPNLLFVKFDRNAVTLGNE